MDLFIELSVILIITTGIASLARLFKQPLIVGYLLSGIIVGPYVLGVLQSNDEVALFSKIGITILLFIVGLSLSPDTIKETGKPALVTGLGQIIFTAVIGFILMRLLGYSDIVSVYGAVALTFSSTIIIMKLLSDRGELESLHGKISIGFLLVQDVVATLLLILVPLYGAHSVVGGSFGLVFLKLFASGAILSIVLYAIAKYILPKFSDYLARSPELLFLFSISWGLVLATVFYKIGFSIEIGALIAGVTLSASKYSYEISSRMRPLRDFFIVLFFVLLGSQLVISNMTALIVPAILLSLFVLIGNPIIVYILMNLLGYTNKTGFMAGLTVAQISEFSLILIALGFSSGHIDESIVTLITMVGIITIAGSTYFIMYADKLYTIVSRILPLFTLRNNSVSNTGNDSNTSNYDIIIFGYGRVGTEFALQARKEKKKYLVVDFDPTVFSSTDIDDSSFEFGDAEDVEFLGDIGFVSSPMVVSTIPNYDINALLCSYYREHNKEGTLLVVSHSVEHAQLLYKAGATYVILPHYLGAYHAVEMLQEYAKDSDIFKRARKVQDTQFKKLRKMSK